MTKNIYAMLRYEKFIEKNNLMPILITEVLFFLFVFLKNEDTMHDF